MTGTISKEKIQIHLARLKKEGTIFEIDIDPDAALAFKNGSLGDVGEVLKSETIFFDAKKGLRASQERLRALFQTDDVYTIAAEIIKKGEVQVTSDHRAAEREERKKKIIGMIHANSVDPRTEAPHTPARIEAALEQGKIKINDNQTAEEQLQDIVKQLRPILPIKFEMKEIELHLLADHAHKGYGTVRKFGTVLSETWNNDGSWTGILEIPGGLYDEFSDTVHSLTSGRTEIKIIRTRS